MAVNLSELAQPVLVTGAFGFIGRRVVDALLELGAEDICAFDLPGLTMPPHWQGRVRYIPGDMSYRPDVDRAMRGVATVIHLAAMVGDWIPLSRHQLVTVEGSRFLFDAALHNQSRVVLSSSIVVYGDQLTNGPTHEDKPWGKPVGPYSICKQAQERMAWRYYREKGMSLSVVRPANVYGAGSKPWVHDLVDTLRTGAPVLINGGDFNAALVHVDNVVQLLLLCATKEAAIGEAFNGGDGNSATWKQYVTDLAKILRVSSPKSLPGSLVMPLTKMVERIWSLLGLTQRPPITAEALNLVGAETLLGIEKAQTFLGYQPEVNYEQGIREVQNYVVGVWEGV